MKTSRLHDTLALVAHLGVIVGIVFLVVEIRQNTVATDNETAWARTAATLELNALIISDLDRATRSTEQSNWSREQFQDYQISHPAEAQQDAYFYRSRLLLWQTRYLAQSEPDVRATLRALMKSALASNNTMRYVNGSEQTLAQVYPSFRSFLDSILVEIESEN